MSIEPKVIDLAHSVSVLNPEASAIDIVDAITRRVSQARAMCAMPNSADGCVITETYMWALQGQIEEAQVLFDELLNKIDLRALA